MKIITPLLLSMMTPFVFASSAFGQPASYSRDDDLCKAVNNDPDDLALHFKRQYYNLDKYMRGQMGGSIRAYTSLKDLTIEQQTKWIGATNGRMRTAIPYLGDIIPRLKSEQDLLPMATQLGSGHIEPPYTGDSKEALQVLLVQDLIQSAPDGGETMASFLDAIEALLVGLPDPADAPLSTKQSEALDSLIVEVFAAYTEGFEPIVRNVVLDDDFAQTTALMINAVCFSSSDGAPLE